MSDELKTPKKQTNAPASGKRKKKKKGKGGAVFLIILLLIVGGAAALLYFNIYNIRNMAFDVLRNIPLVGGFIPEAQETPPGRFDGMNAGQLTAEIERLEKRVETLTKEKDAQQEEINGYKTENERLLDFEQQQEQFKKDQEDFNAMVAGEKPLDFWKFYQQVSPELAAEIAREAAGISENEKLIRHYLDTIGDMDERSSAGMLEILMDTDATLVRDVMRRITSENAAAIIENMSKEKGSALLKLMYPAGM